MSKELPQSETHVARGRECVRAVREYAESIHGGTIRTATIDGYICLLESRPGNDQLVQLLTELRKRNYFIQVRFQDFGNAEDLHDEEHPELDSSIASFLSGALDAYDELKDLPDQTPLLQAREHVRTLARVVYGAAEDINVEGKQFMSSFFQAMNRLEKTASEIQHEDIYYFLKLPHATDEFELVAS